MDALPSQQRGGLMLGLWVNAMLTLALQGAELALTIRALRRAKYGGRPLKTAMDLAVSPTTAAVLSVSAAHKLARQQFLRVLDERIRAQASAR